MSAACLCGSVCKIKCDQKLHQEKILMGVHVLQLTGAVPRRMQNEPDTETSGYFKLCNLHTKAANTEHYWFMWPAANKQRKWMYYENADGILQYTVKEKVY